MSCTLEVPITRSVYIKPTAAVSP